MHYNMAIDNFDASCKLINEMSDYEVMLPSASQAELKNIKLLMLEARTYLKGY